MESRYRIEQFHAKSLEGNPLSSPVNRDISVYLPPGYHENSSTTYPVIYFLHGYGGNNHQWTLAYRKSKDIALPLKLIPKKYLKRIDVERLLDFEKIDELILSDTLKPFILVQPDASLHVPNIHGTKNLQGKVGTKGSFYANSPYSGNYRDYIVKDVIGYIDETFRTIPDKEHRALMGASMGGYGTLHVSSHHPESFSSAVALSPGNFEDISLLNWKLRIPIYEEIFGEKMSVDLGDKSWSDILDTCDLVFSKEQPLVPSIKLDKNGEIVGYNQLSLENWRKFGIMQLAERFKDNLKQVKLLLSCDINDEFGLAGGAQKYHEKLLALGVSHDFDLYEDPKTQLSPHAFGIGYHILPGIKYCLRNFKD